MYYNRTLSDKFAKLLEPGGELRWLFEFVLKNKELDFLTGSNADEEWISVYRGLSRMVKITEMKKAEGVIKLHGDRAYKKLSKSLYGKKKISEPFCSELEELITIVSNTSLYNSQYNNKKEGYYQTEFSRRYGICGASNDDFVIIDKEAVVGHENISEKQKIYGVIQERYNLLQRKISSIDVKRYGKRLGEKSIGNEVDFLALEKSGKIFLIEFKDGSNTAGVYLSPLQIGMYKELFEQIPRSEFEESIIQMIRQKQRIGLVNPDWKIPKIIEIIPVLVIANYKSKSIGKEKYHEIMSIMRKEMGDSFLNNIITYNYTTESGLVEW